MALKRLVKRRMRQKRRTASDGDELFVLHLRRLGPEGFDDSAESSFQTALDALLKEYSDVFPAELPKGLPPQRSVDHRIELAPHAKPPAKKPYRLSPMEREELRSQLTVLLDSGMIRPSRSPYGAPILFVRKKTGGLRLCVDYRALNALTIKNRTTLPRIDELLETIRGAVIFTKIDLRSAYHQIRLHYSAIDKTAFRTHLGHFEWTVLPFGLTNAPATFQTLMFDIFRPYLGKFVLAYLDDLVIFSTSPEQHLEHL
jgi:hypothetical protein